MNATIHIIATPWDHPDGISLRNAQRAELAARYHTDNSEPGPAPTADDISLFLIAYKSSQPVACGGLRALHADPATGHAPPGDAEIKRMFVVPDFRGKGKGSVAGLVLRELEQSARARGWRRLVLETGMGQPDAIAFYRREGYEEIERFGGYVGSDHSVCLGRDI